MLAALIHSVRSLSLSSRNQYLILLATLLLSPFAPATPALVVANWNDYIHPELLARFTAETGIQVDYRTYETDAEALALVRQEFPPDVVVPDSSYLPTLIEEGFLSPLPLRSLPSFDDIDPLILSRLSSADPKRQYTVPYFWGRIGIVMDRKRVEQALGGPAGRSWGLLLDPQQLAKLSSCGATLLDARQKFVAIWMNWYGALAERPSGREQRAFLQALIELRPHVRAVDNLAYLEDMPAGRQCIAMAWEGDARAIVTANPSLELFIPDEGSTVYVDTLVVPARSRMADQAWRFVEFMSRPEIAYLNARHVLYNSPYKSVTRGLLANHGDDWRSLRAVGPGKSISLLSVDSPNEQIDSAWARFAGERKSGLAIGAIE